MSGDRGDNRYQEGHGGQDIRERYKELVLHLIYGLLITVVLGAAEFLFLWREHHGLALLFAATILSLVAIYEIPFNLRLHVGWLLGFQFVVILVAAEIYSDVGPALPQETETHGWLRPGNQPRPASACDNFISASVNGQTVSLERSDVILLGDMGVIHATDGRIGIVSIDGEVLVTMESSLKGILVSVDVRNKDGLLVARIENNEFHLVQAQMAYRNDRGNDRSTLAVFDPSGDEVFRVRYINQHTIRFLGKFYGRNKTPLVVGENFVTGKLKSMGGCGIFVGSTKGAVWSF